MAETPDTVSPHGGLSSPNTDVEQIVKQTYSAEYHDKDVEAGYHLLTVRATDLYVVEHSLFQQGIHVEKELPLDLKHKYLEQIDPSDEEWIVGVRIERNQKD